MMRVEEMSTRKSLPALAPEWQTLCKRAISVIPFQTPNGCSRDVDIYFAAANF
jgi:hypothetical protein